MKPTFDEAFALFLAGCQKIVDAADLHGKPQLSYKRGSRYAKVIKKDSQTSVFCFVQIDNGDVLKAESWSRPAMHPRGNIYDRHNGLERILWTGPEYLR